MFQWNRGGWFGAQIGSTLWLVLLGALFLVQSDATGIPILALGLIPNALGWALWHRRERLSPYSAIQALIAASGVCAFGAMIVIWIAGAELPGSDRPGAWFLLIYPGLMLAFHLQERSARRAAR